MDWAYFVGAGLGIVGQIIASVVLLRRELKVNLSSLQDKLIRTLQDTIEAQDRRIGMLEAENTMQAGHMTELREKIDALEGLCGEQAVIIAKLERARAKPTTAYAPRGGKN